MKRLQEIKLIAEGSERDRLELQKQLDAQRLRADTAEAENRILRHSNASFLETVAKVCDLLGIDLDDAKHADGQPSDVLFGHAKNQAEKLAAAEQRISEMTRALAGMLFAFDDGVGREWSAPLLDYARKLTNAAEFDAALNPNPEAAPEGWVPCSPEWIEAGGDCATAKRWSSKVWDRHSHWHPNPEAESHE